MKKTVVVVAAAVVAAGLLAVPVLAVNIQPRTLTEFFNNPAWPPSVETSAGYVQGIADGLGVPVGTIYDRDLDDGTYGSAPDLSAASVGKTVVISGTLPVQGTSGTPGKGDVSYPTNIEFLSGLVGLDAANNMIEDIQFVSSMPDLKVLNLANNKIADLTPLLDAPGLTTLNLSGNLWGVGGGLDDISVLTITNFPNLKFVDLQNTNTGDQMDVIEALADACVEVILPDGSEQPRPVACTPVTPPESGSVVQGLGAVQGGIVIAAIMALIGVAGFMMGSKVGGGRIS